ncbi:MAG: hypothetical protein IPP59_18415 [Betaproteobacteria bacterium]|jgi:hypothetical protein|nr:hypothetical protein [Betaproteobacteria bacterium]MBK9785985.1 hypothetical protein [Candidatus Dechloromonas phosphorivorans]
MNKLISALQRLYFLQDQQWHSQSLNDGGDLAYAAEGPLTPAIVTKSLAGELTVGLNLVSPTGMARAMVVSFARATDWEQVANLYQAVQDELDLPAPAVSVSGRKGYSLWFSLAEALPLAQIQAFLAALRLKYLADIPLAHLELQPDALAIKTLAPARHNTTGKWSAFIDPSMGSMFIVEPGLEMAPILDRQAGMLAGLKSIKTANFQRALSILQAPSELDGEPALTLAEAAARLPTKVSRPPDLADGYRYSKLGEGNTYADPRDFLLAVMNDSSVGVKQRIKAAKALLPYFVSTASKDE